jgi:transcriptional regulator GlxA family with amidase domain
LTIPFHEALAALVGERCAPLVHARVDAELHATLMTEIETIARAGFAGVDDYDIVAATSLSRMLLALHAGLHRRRDPPTAPDPLTLIHQHIHRHYREQLSLPTLAELCRMTPNYLARRFKARFGAPPIAYQHRLRIHAAATLLRTTDHPVKHIAELVGFGDAYFFSRTFRRHQGEAPGAYRRRSQGIPN